MPFITEEIWQALVSHLPPDEARPDSIVVAPYPTARGTIDERAEEEMKTVIDIVHSIRNARAQSRIEPARWIEAQIYVKDQSAIEAHRRAIEALARVQPLVLLDLGGRGETHEGAMVLVLRDVEIVLPTMADLDAERRRLEKDKEALEGRIAGLKSRLGNESFLTKAPAEVVKKEQMKLRDSESRLEKIDERLAQLSRR
jgi:valyl-tRNA synthetase